MTKLQQQVREFHKEFDLQIGNWPQLVGEKTADLRIALIQEELDEYKAAIEAKDTVAIADALGDLLYVVYGAAVTHGIDMEPITDEIHRSNMSKVGGHKSLEGKWIKPSTYSPANLPPILMKQTSMAATNA